MGVFHTSTKSVLEFLLILTCFIEEREMAEPPSRRTFTHRFCGRPKFFGPHIGVLYAKATAMSALSTLKVKAQKDVGPFKFETGTLNHEGIAGAAEAVEFIADAGAKHESGFNQELGDLEGRRRKIVAGMLSFERYEKPLAEHFRRELVRIPKIKVYAPPAEIPRTSTISFTVEGAHPAKVAEGLAQKGIFVWHGDFYAAQMVKSLNLEESGGLVRVGLAPYNTAGEIDRTLEIVSAI
jgi:selenocysteine lyase/cysteine desulfurase